MSNQKVVELGEPTCRIGYLFDALVGGERETKGDNHFVFSMAAPVASGWSGCRVGLKPTGKRRLSTAHTLSRRR
jgi:hypothetical protein